MSVTDYIERESLVRWLEEMQLKHQRKADAFGAVKTHVNNMPPAIVRKHGKWIEDDYGYNSCSNCRYEFDESDYKTPYCPECGAEMEDNSNENND